MDRVRTEQVDDINEELPLLEGYMPHGKRGRPSGVSLFLLTPTRLDAPEWELSSTTDPVCVEARHVYHARAIAALRFDVHVGAPSGVPLRIHPWWSPRLVSACEVNVPPPDVQTITANGRKPRFLLRPQPRADHPSARD